MSTDTPPYDYTPELEPADVLDAQAVREVGAPKAARPNGHRASPHDTNAEEATLGAMLTTATACDDVLATGISADHFYVPNHATVFAAIAAVRNAGDKPDFITVCANLPAGEDWQNRVIQLMGGHTWDSRNGASYARRVIHMAKLRKVLAGALEAADHARADDLPAAVAAIEGFIAPDDTSSHGIAHAPLGDFLTTDEPDHDWVIPDLLERTDRILLTGPEGGGKALAIDTPIPTPSGFRPLADLQVGDFVFAPDGTPASGGTLGGVPHVVCGPLGRRRRSDGPRCLREQVP